MLNRLTAHALLRSVIAVTAADALTEQAGRLRVEVRDFLDTVRAA